MLTHGWAPGPAELFSKILKRQPAPVANRETVIGYALYKTNNIS